MAKRKKKAKFVINNKLRGNYGEEDPRTNKVEINLKMHRKHKFKKHYTAKQNLADTIYHEGLHVKHPKMHEKTVYKKTAKRMKTMPVSEQKRLISKLRPAKKSAKRLKVSWHKSSITKPTMTKAQHFAILGMV